MKERKYGKRLLLGKKTLANLNGSELNTLRGGITHICDTEYTGCVPCHTIGETNNLYCATQIDNCYSGVGMTECNC